MDFKLTFFVFVDIVAACYGLRELVVYIFVTSFRCQLKCGLTLRIKQYHGYKIPL